MNPLPIKEAANNDRITRFSTAGAPYHAHLPMNGRKEEDGDEMYVKIDMIYTMQVKGNVLTLFSEYTISINSSGHYFPVWRDRIPIVLRRCESRIHL